MNRYEWHCICSLLCWCAIKTESPLSLTAELSVVGWSELLLLCVDRVWCRWLLLIARSFFACSVFSVSSFPMSRVVLLQQVRKCLFDVNSQFFRPNGDPDCRFNFQLTSKENFVSGKTLFIEPYEEFQRQCIENSQRCINHWLQMYGQMCLLTTWHFNVNLFILCLCLLIQCESKKSPLRFSDIFSQTDGNF